MICMKKGLLTGLLMLMASATLFAQSQIGLRAGANFATIKDGIDKLENIEEPWVPRLTLGIATSLWVNESFAFAPEFNYSQRGYEATGEGNSLVTGPYSYTYTYDYNFFEVPVLARVFFGPEVLRGYLNMGPTFSYLMGGKETVDSGNSRKLNVEDDKYNRFELGASLGGGIQLNTGIGSFLIDLRYHTGLTDIQKSGYSPFYGLISEQPEKYKTQYVSTSLIFLAPGKK